MAESAAVDTSLYVKEGETKIPVNPATTAAQVVINDEEGNASTLDVQIQAIQTKIGSLANGGASFKGVLTSTLGLPTVSYKAGWEYAVQEAGTYAGRVCEVGDYVICIKDYASGSASDSDWTVLQANLVGAILGPDTSVVGHIPVFDSTAGNKLKDSGFTIGTSVPADAKFTDTTYKAATASAEGLMSATQFTKLAGIEEGADKTDSANVKAAGALMADEASADKITDTDAKVIMTAEERSKLSGVATGAEVNQNAFSVVTAGGTTVTSDAKTDTLNIEAGEGITVTGDATNKKIVVAETYVDSCIVDSLDNVPSNLRNGGLIFLRKS